MERERERGGRWAVREGEQTSINAFLASFLAPSTTQLKLIVRWPSRSLSSSIIKQSQRHRSLYIVSSELSGYSHRSSSFLSSSNSPVGCWMTSTRATKKQGFSMLGPSPKNEEEEEEEEEEGMLPELRQPQLIRGGVGAKKKVLRKQLSMRETNRELKWEKKKKLMYLRNLRGKIDGVSEEALDGEVKGNGRVRSLTDEDLDELRGSIDLGFGFNEENGGRDLCRTLPALNLYFAVNRQFSDPNIRLSTLSPTSTPTATATSSATSSASTLYGTPSPRSPYGRPNQDQGADGWKIINPGDSPQDVKTKLRHWAQVVACSVRHCC